MSDTNPTSLRRPTHRTWHPKGDLRPRIRALQWSAKGAHVRFVGVTGEPRTVLVPLDAIRIARDGRDPSPLIVPTDGGRAPAAFEGRAIAEALSDRIGGTPVPATRLDEMETVIFDPSEALDLSDFAVERWSEGPAQRTQQPRISLAAVLFLGFLGIAGGVAVATLLVLQLLLR